MTQRSAKPHRAPIDIVIPKDMPEESLPAILLAIMAVPPTSADDVRCRETMEILRLRTARLTTPSDQALDNDLPFTLALMHRKETTAFTRVGRALAAAHTMMPTVVRQHLGSLGVAPAALPLAYRRSQSLDSEIVRTMWHEKASADAAAQRGERPPPRRMPTMTGSDGSHKNFMTRVLKPTRPVLHLAVGMAQVIDMIERQLIKTLHSPRVWEAKGYRTVHIDDGHGVTTPRPNIPTSDLLAMPEFARQVIGLSDVLLPAVTDVLAAGRARPVPMVRLLLE